MAAGGVVFFDRPGEAQGAFLDQVQQVQPLALVALGQVDHQAQVGRDHLGLGPFAQAHGALFNIVVAAGFAATACIAAAFLQLNQGLNLAAQGELLFRCEQLVTPNFAQIGT